MRPPASPPAPALPEPLDSGSNVYTVPFVRRTIDQVYDTGVRSTLPAASVDRTRIVCLAA